MIRPSFEPLRISRDLRERLRMALAEDVGTGDVTTSAIVDPDAAGRGVIIARETGVLCGLPVVEQVFRLADRRLKTKPLANEGDGLQPDDSVLDVRGPMAAILTAERVALNFLQRMSGVATLTTRFVEALEGRKTKIFDTRKTTPLWRDLEKYAVRVGGGENHRFGLHDMVLIKNNHADAAGGLAEAIRLVKRARRGRRRLDIVAETRDMDEVRAAVREQVGVIMLDNFSTAGMRRALAEIPPSIATEASGGITVQRVRALSKLGLDRISVGALTHSAPAMDFSLRYRKP